MLDSGAYYDDDDAIPRSPGLEPVVVNPKPEPSPPPSVAQVCLPPPRFQNVSSPTSRRQRKSNRRKTRPTQGDLVLIREMAPSRPDIAQEVSEQALNSDSGSEDDQVMDDDSSDAAAFSRAPNATEPSQSNTQPVGLPQNASSAVDTTNVPTARPPHRDSVVEADDPKPSTLVLSQPSTVAILPSHARLNTNGMSSMAPGTSTLSATSPNQPTPLHGAITNGHPHDNFLATSPQLQQLTISQSRGSATDTLPALQTQSPPRDGSVASPNQQQQLPSFRHFDEIARSATSDQEVSRTNGFLHRQSVSSVGQSPTSIVRQLSISSHSPATPFPPLSASSPVSASSELQRGDLFLRSGGGGVFGADARRPSQASEGGPYASTLHSASTSESYQSSDGLSPGTAQTPIEGRPRHMSLDGALASRLLPPPVGSGIQHIPSHGSGAFKCEYPNCNAAPFQTQYLLK
ncbi:Nn.00g035020.m01.CDS01 [Neocucurbitaria sp. VM-36]